MHRRLGYHLHLLFVALSNCSMGVGKFNAGQNVSIAREKQIKLNPSNFRIVFFYMNLVAGHSDS